MSAEIDIAVFNYSPQYYYVFECKDCGNVWFSLFCFCSKCESTRFRIMDYNQISEYMQKRFNEIKIYQRMNQELIEENNVAEDLEKG
jgi:primosomal protein N'